MLQSKKNRIITNSLSKYLRVKKIVPTGILFLFLFGALNATAQTSSIRGIVYEAGTGITLPHATVQLFPHNIFTVTNLRGEFEFPRMEAGRVQVVIQMLGRETIDTVVVLGRAQDLNLAFHMRASSFHLETVVVTATESRAGASTSSTISRAAMDHMQINNLAAIMQLLPGGVTENPNLTQGAHFTLRSSGGPTDAHHMMNSLGTAIIVDGAPLSNNANLQSVTTTRSGTVQDVGASSSPTAVGGALTQGVDLRQISTDNIESIEVIRGIPSAEHGDLTSGAVIIRSRAGYEPLQVRIKVNPYIYEASVSRGIRLGGNRGAINTSLNYAYGVNNLTESYVFFQRVNARILYSNVFGRLSSNTSFDYTMGRDTRRENPDDWRMMRSSGATSNSFRLNTSGRFNFDHSWLRNIDYTLSGNITTQNSWRGEFLEASRLPMTTSRTHGSVMTTHGRPVYNYITGERITNTPDAEHNAIAYVVPDGYYSHHSIHGMPVNFFGRLSANFVRQLTPNFNNRLVVGTDFRSNGNLGMGPSFDPKTPPLRAGLTNATLRPRKFRDIPFINQLGLYAENSILWIIANRNLNISAGVRYDKVGHLSAVVPRLNASFEIIPHVLSIRGGYGIAAKAPVLLHMHPERAYFDLPNFDRTFGTVAPPEWRYAVITTHVFDVDNSDLEMATNQKSEIGLDLRLGQMSFVATFYTENMRNGYRFASDISTFRLIEHRRYTIPDDMTNPDRLLHYETDNRFVTFARPRNDVISTSRGVEFDFNTGRIADIRTSFVFSGAYRRASFWNSNYTFRSAPDDRIWPVRPLDQEVNITLWDPKAVVNERETFVTTLRAIHNIPRLGFVVSLTTQVNWITRSWQTHGQDSIPLRFLSMHDGQAHDFTREMFDDVQLALQQNQRTEFTSHFRTPLTTALNRTPLSFRPHFLMNIHLTKEVSDFLTVAFFANNMFSQQPLLESNRQPGVFTRMYSNVPLFFGVELRATIRR